MTAKATRHPKTPAQRAQETVDVLDRRLAKILAAQEALNVQARALAPDITAVRKRLDYAKASPDLLVKLAPGQKVPIPPAT